MPRTKIYSLRVPLRTGPTGEIRDTMAIFDMLRYDGSRVTSVGSDLVIEANHPHTIARWQSFGIHVEEVASA